MNTFIGNSFSQVVGKDIVKLRFTSRKTVTLKEVLHVPDIRKNLLSRSLLSKHGFKLVFEFDKFVPTKNKLFVGKGFVNSRMFKLNVINEMSSTSTCLIKSCELWHSRLGHIHYNKVKHMSNLGLIHNLANTNNEKCIVCIKYKVTRTHSRVCKDH